MSGPRYVFFYGTLMAGGGPMAALAHRYLDDGRPAGLRGRLYAVPDAQGWYPALVPGAGRVCGMVYRAQPGFARRALRLLDRYEGAPYRRLRVKVCTVDATFPAQAYIWRGPLPLGAKRIASGDFRQWLARTRAHAFGTGQAGR